jgi:hypothetical protein
MQWLARNESIVSGKSHAMQSLIWGEMRLFAMSRARKVGVQWCRFCGLEKEISF